MTNLVNKTTLLDVINEVFTSLEFFDAPAELLERMGSPELKARNSCTRHALAALRQGLTIGKFDASLEDVFDEVCIGEYVDEDLDTEDMDDLAPEEESLQDEFVGGIIILDPNTSPEERVELVEFYTAIGFKVQ